MVCRITWIRSAHITLPCIAKIYSNFSSHFVVLLYSHRSHCFAFHYVNVSCFVWFKWFEILFFRIQQANTNLKLPTTLPPLSVTIAVLFCMDCFGKVLNVHVSIFSVWIRFIRGMSCKSIQLLLCCVARALLNTTTLFYIDPLQWVWSSTIKNSTSDALVVRLQVNISITIDVQTHKCSQMCR